MKLLERFDGFVNKYYLIKEAIENENAFVLVSGATDPVVLTDTGAAKTGIKKNTKYKLEIDGINDMLAIGETGTLTPNKTVEVLGKTSKPNHDYIKLTVDGKEYKIDDKGRIDLNFGRSTKISVEGSENGLLALCRAMSSIYEFVNDTKFDKNKEFRGKMVIELKKQRSGTYLAAINQDKTTGIRTTEYSKAVDLWDKGGNLKESVINESDKPKPSADSNSIAAGSISDAIKAAHMIAAGTDYKNRFSAFKGALDIKQKMKEGGEYNDVLDAKDKQSRIELASYILSYSIHYILWANDILLDGSNVFKADLQPECLEIIKSQPSIGDKPVQLSQDDASKYESKSIEDGIKKILQKFTPKVVQNADYKIFKPYLLDYYNFFTDCMVKMVSKTMKDSGDQVFKAYAEGPEASRTQNIATKQKSYTPGSAKN
jgi:hypothetical protein